jgi:hypothetical protein
VRSDLSLAPLQQWMQEVVTHPDDVRGAVASKGATRFVKASRVGDVILPSRTLDPVERVGIYHGMYMMRMVEALQEDYPALAHFLGHEEFEAMVRHYVQHYPSRSYTFNRLGDHLPAFIAELNPPRRIFLCDLARLELAMTEVFDEEERAPMPSDAIASVPPEQIEAIRFTTIPALRLLTFDYDANGAFQAFRNEEQIRPRRVKSWLAVHRRDYSVYRMPLERPAFTLLRSLARGETLAQALATFQRRMHRMPGQSELHSWFRNWSAAGLFASLTIAA